MVRDLELVLDNDASSSCEVCTEKVEREATYGFFPHKFQVHAKYLTELLRIGLQPRGEGCGFMRSNFP
jgi:hypothetical protein